MLIVCGFTRIVILGPITSIIFNDIARGSLIDKFTGESKQTETEKKNTSTHRRHTHTADTPTHTHTQKADLYGDIAVVLSRFSVHLKNRALNL